MEPRISKESCTCWQVERGLTLHGSRDPVWVAVVFPEDELAAGFQQAVQMPDLFFQVGNGALALFPFSTLSSTPAP